MQMWSGFAACAYSCNAIKPGPECDRDKAEHLQSVLDGALHATNSSLE